MGKFSRTFAFFLTLIIAMPCLILIVKPANAQSISKPSVPEFIANYEEHPYDIPPVYSRDEYTGTNIILEEGKHIQNQTLTFTIKNQAFTSSANGSEYYLFYSIRAKGHYGGNWQEFFQIDPYHFFTPNVYSSSLPNGLLAPSNSQYTVVAVPVRYPLDSEVDLQMEAIIWQKSQVFISDHPGTNIAGGHYEQRYSFYDTSGWGNTQTIAIPEINPTVTPTDTPTPTGNEPTDNSITLPLTTLALIILVVALVFSLALIIFYRKRQRGKPNE